MLVAAAVLTAGRAVGAAGVRRPGGAAGAGRRHRTAIDARDPAAIHRPPTPGGRRSARPSRAVFLKALIRKRWPLHPLEAGRLAKRSARLQVVERGERAGQERIGEHPALRARVRRERDHLA